MKQYILKYRIVVLLGVFAWLIPVSSWAVGNWYNSAASGDWETAATWGGSGSPVDGDGVIVKNADKVTHDGSLIWTNGQIEVQSYGILIIYGDLTLANTSLYVKDYGTLIVTGNLIKSGDFQTGASTATIVVGGDYTSTGGSTWTNGGSIYVLGTKTCTDGGCSAIKDQTAWEAAGSPGSEYLTSSWWEDHLVHAGESVDGGSICAASSTFTVAAVTENAGDMSANTFEWAVYGGTISGNTGGGQISANSGTVDGHTASVLSYNGISVTTTYSITVDWTETDFDGAYVAVRQTSADGCSDGLWSVFELGISATAAPTATSPQNFCFGDSHLVSDLVATGSNIQWYAVASGGTALSETTELSSGTYYASQTIDGCESTERLAVTVTVSEELAVTGTVTKASCSGNADGAIELDSEDDFNAIEFDQSKKNYLETGKDLLYNLSAFTIEGWVKFDKSENTASRISLFGQDNVVEFGLNNGGIFIYTYPGQWVGNDNYSYTREIGDLQWHHLALTGNSQKVTFYIDGVEEYSISHSGVSNFVTNGVSSGTARIGGQVLDSNEWNGSSLNGQMTTVGYWSRALSPEELAARASSIQAFEGTENGLIEGFNMSEGSGTTTASVNGATTASLVNSPTWVGSLYTYSWTGPNGYTASTKNISKLEAGDYTVTVTSG